MKTLMTVCLGALIAVPPVAFAQTATTTTETPATTAPAASAPVTPAPTTTPAPVTPAPTTTPAPVTSAPTTTPAPAADAAVDTTPNQMDAVEYVVAEATNSVYASDLIGQSVYGSTDEKTGDINDLLLDEAGNVTAVIIGVGGFIGLGEKDVAVTLESLTITNINSTYRISIRATEAELESAPVYSRADGTSSDRLGAFERAYSRTRVEAEKALDEASRRASELYEQGKQAVNDLTKSDEKPAEPKPAQ